VYLTIGNTSRGPLTHLHLWLQKHHSDSNATWRKVVDFVCEVSQQIAREWDTLLCDNHEADHPNCKWSRLLNICNRDGNELEAQHRALAVQHCILQRCEYARRIETQTQSFPMALCWLLWQKPSVSCEERQKCAHDLKDYSLQQVPKKSS